MKMIFKSKTDAVVSPRLSEHEEQAALIQWAKIYEHTYPVLRLLYAIPNGAKLPFSKKLGGARFSSEGRKLKDEGLKKGVSDLCLPVARGGYHGLYLEMKAMDGKLSADQKEWVKLLMQEGYLALAAYGFDQGREVLENYILGKYIRLGC